MPGSPFAATVAARLNALADQMEGRCPPPPKRLKVLWDIDGVLSMTTEAVLTHLQSNGKLLGATPDHVTDWDWVWASQEVSVEEVWESYLDNDVLASAGVHPSGLKAYNLLLELGYAAHTVTGRKRRPGVEAMTENWLFQKGFLLHRLEFVPAKEKAAYAVSEGCDLAIEDHFETAQALAEAGVHTLLIGTAYNDLCANCYGPRFWRVPREGLATYVYHAHIEIVERRRLKTYEQSTGPDRSPQEAGGDRKPGSRIPS